MTTPQVAPEIQAKLVELRPVADEIIGYELEIKILQMRLKMAMIRLPLARPGSHGAVQVCDCDYGHIQQNDDPSDHTQVLCPKCCNLSQEDWERLLGITMARDLQR